MKSDDLSPFSEACGLTRPIDLKVMRQGGVLAEGELDIPCAVVGRDPSCDVVLTGPDISLRHACIQAVGGRVCVLDLGSRLGLTVAGRKQLLAWLTPREEVLIADYRITLRKPLFARPTVPDASPLLPAERLDGCPKVTLRFLNGKSADHEWAVNRLITMVGKSPECKISLSAEDVAAFHCYFVQTPRGLWVVDLLAPGGVLVNNEFVRFALLRDGDQVAIGRFRLQVRYPQVVTPEPTAVPRPAPTEEVRDLLVTTPPVAADAMVAQLAAAQSAILGQFQVSITKLFETFGDLQREQIATLQAELARFAELNIEMQRLQTQLVKPEHRSLLPSPDDMPELTEESAATHNWVFERMAHLQAERQSLWTRLSTLVQK